MLGLIELYSQDHDFYVVWCMCGVCACTHAQSPGGCQVYSYQLPYSPDTGDLTNLELMFYSAKLVTSKSQ